MFVQRIFSNKPCFILANLSSPILHFYQFWFVFAEYLYDCMHPCWEPSHRDHHVHIKWSNMHCNGIACTIQYWSKVGILCMLFIVLHGFHIRYRSKARTGEPYWRRRFSTVDLLVPTILDQLLFRLKILFTI